MSFAKQFLQGYVRIQIQNREYQRFLNLCAKRGITFWRIEATDGVWQANVSVPDFRRLREVVHKSHTRLHIVKKTGLPFILKKQSRYKFFYLGFLLGGCLICWLSTFIWDIRVTGSRYYDREQIIKYLEQGEVPLGTKRRMIDCAKLEETLMQAFPEIAWISCERKGTSLVITLTETITKNVTRPSGEPENIIAVKEADICKLITRSGTPVKALNDHVNKGDILISGAVNIYNDFEELLETDYVSADGDVYGITQLFYSDSIPLNYYGKEYSGSLRYGIRVQIGTRLFSLWEPDVSGLQADLDVKNCKLHIGRTFYLPLSVDILTYRLFTPVRKHYEREEAVEKAREKLQLKIRDLQEKGVEIMENNVKIECGDTDCTAEGTLVLKEQIGVSRPFTPPPANTENIVR